MKEYSIYDILGVLVPGTVLTVGVVTLFPDTSGILTQKDFTVGSFGLIALVSYVMGNLVAALGNLLEAGWWKLRKGSPTTRALGKIGKIRTRDHQAVEAVVLSASYGPL